MSLTPFGTERSKIYIEIMNEGITFNCEDAGDVETAIIEEYERFDLCIAELLESIAIHGLSVIETVTVYANLMKQIENDEVVRFAEGERHNLYNN